MIVRHFRFSYEIKRKATLQKRSFVSSIRRPKAYHPKSWCMWSEGDREFLDRSLSSSSGFTHVSGDLFINKRSATASRLASTFAGSVVQFWNGSGELCVLKKFRKTELSSAPLRAVYSIMLLWCLAVNVKVVDVIKTTVVDVLFADFSHCTCTAAQRFG